MRNIVLVLLFGLLGGCEPLIPAFDGGGSADSGMDSSITMDSSVHPHDDAGMMDSSLIRDARIDSAVDATVDAVVSMDAVIPMDTSMPMDVMHNHDSMIMQDSGVILPVGSTGFSVPRISSTTEAIGGPNDIGAFRTDCEFSHMNYDDPLVYPGQSG